MAAVDLARQRVLVQRRPMVVPAASVVRLSTPEQQVPVEVAVPRLSSETSTASRTVERVVPPAVPVVPQPPSVVERPTRVPMGEMCRWYFS